MIGCGYDVVGAELPWRGLGVVGVLLLIRLSSGGVVGVRVRCGWSVCVVWWRLAAETDLLRRSWGAVGLWLGCGDDMLLRPSSRGVVATRN